MTSCLSQTPEEIVTEISMSEIEKIRLIVEGVSDGIFFSTKELVGNPEVIVAYGWENVVAVISKIIEERIVASVLGFIDRDYREEIGIKIDEENVIVSDFRDLEISLFESSALHRILVEYGAANKLPRLTCGSVDIFSVKEKIYLIARKIGKLRYYSLKNQYNYSFKKIDFSKIIDSETLEISEDVLINQINSKSEDKISHDILTLAYNCELPNRLLDVKYLCSGHDVIEFLGISLKKLWGSNNSGSVSREKLESSFRIGYSNKEFENTDMYKALNAKLKSLNLRK